MSELKCFSDFNEMENNNYNYTNDYYFSPAYLTKGAKTVYENKGVMLEPEVRFLGEF